MKKTISIIIVVVLSGFIAYSTFVMGTMNETQQWTLLFFDVVAFLQICIFLWLLKQEG
jgi:hypothetical protein